VISDNGLLTTVGYVFPGQKPVYALEGESTFEEMLTEGSIAVAGTAVKWARDQLGIIKTANEVGELAAKVDGPFRPGQILTFRHGGGSVCQCVLRPLGSVLAKRCPRDNLYIRSE
jgi:hypothetical protein